MSDVFHFPDNDHGREIRAQTADLFRKQGREVEETEEIITIKILKLIIHDKRPGEGQIAANMKARMK